MIEQQAPWYRHRWPWIVMSGPAIVVVAGLWTAGVAARNSDALVTEDYYRQGIGINRVLATERNAASLGVVARFTFDGRAARIELPGSIAPAASLRLALTRPARALDDETVDLAQVAPGVYEGMLRSAPRGVTRIVLEDREQTWRLEGAMRDAPRQLTLGTARP